MYISWNTHSILIKNEYFQTQKLKLKTCFPKLSQINYPKRKSEVINWKLHMWKQVSVTKEYIEKTNLKVIVQNVN